MDIRNEIVEFISVSDNNGALLLTGQWGVGKTHLVKDIVKQLNEENGIALPCEVDYKKVEKGFDFRQSSIRLGKKTLVKRRTFADKDTIDSGTL